MNTHKGHCEGALQAQWTLHGAWTAEEIATIEAFFNEHMAPNSGYPWSIYKGKDFNARRVTWEPSFFFRDNTLQELMDRIHHYYATYEGI